MAEYNPITIEDFPEVTSVLSSDQVIVFTESGGKLIPTVTLLSAFSEFVLDDSEIDELESKVAELEDWYKKLEREINNSYLTPAEVKNEYSTKDNFQKVSAKIEKTKDFKTLISDKATKEYLNSIYEELCSKTQRMKTYLGSFDNGDEKYAGKGYKLLMVARALGEGEEEKKEEEKK